MPKIQKIRLKRNVAIAMFLAESDYERNIAFDYWRYWSKNQKLDTDAFPSPLDYDKDYVKLMPVVEKIAALKNDNPLPTECESLEFVLDRFEIKRTSFFLSVFIAENGKWRKFDKDINWSCLNTYHPEHKTVGSADSWRDMIWRTTSEFCLMWCEVNNVKL